MIVRRALIAVSLLVTSAPAAHAATLTTPFLSPSANQGVGCVVTNIGKKPAEVTVEAVGLTGTTLAPSLSTCPTPPATLNARSSCIVAMGSGQDVYFIVKVKGKLRAVATVFDNASSDIVAALPGTK